MMIIDHIIKRGRLAARIIPGQLDIKRHQHQDKARVLQLEVLSRVSLEIAFIRPELRAVPFIESDN